MSEVIQLGVVKQSLQSLCPSHSELSCNLQISELVLGGRQFKSHGDLGPAKGDKNIRAAYGLQVQIASVSTLSHQMITTTLCGVCINIIPILQMAKLMCQPGPRWECRCRMSGGLAHPLPVEPASWHLPEPLCTTPRGNLRSLGGSCPFCGQDIEVGR